MSDPLVFCVDPHCHGLVQPPAGAVAPAISQKPVHALRSVKGIPWPRPTDDKAAVFTKAPKSKPTFPWDFYVCDIVEGLAAVGEILSRDARGKGITRTIPKVFDGATYNTKQYNKFKETFEKVSEKLLQEYVEYGRQDRGEYVRLWEAVHKRQMMLEWVHGSSASAGAESESTTKPAASMHRCSFCELRFPGLVEKQSHEGHQHNYNPSTAIGPDSWRTPLEPPTPDSSVPLYPSVHHAYHHLS
ncbi:hypothetical protein FA13DRAFT_1857083 [Coprinellus micaceus]|uniref:Uncharacterized protein n=1 Tax=Coprinellus micaceus TaxID=71717 RepID=A0A4Y7T8X8_COPMI|nr:hypothetical protein FA13DRAFT_1857083 [Coprinellus micaceus]